MYNEIFMKKAIAVAKKSLIHKDVPVGACVVKDGKVVCLAYNTKEKHNNCLEHAEINAILKAQKKLKTKVLTGCELYVTFEPCLMCVGAILSAKINKIYFGAYDNRFGCANLFLENNFNFKAEAQGGFMAEECGSMISNFFKKIREEEKYANTSFRRY